MAYAGPPAGGRGPVRRHHPVLLTWVGRRPGAAQPSPAPAWPGEAADPAGLASCRAGGTVVLGGPGAALVSSGSTGSVARQISRVITWMAPAVGMAISAATKAPKVPPSQLPSDAPTRMESSTSSGLTLTVRLITTGFRTWFSICV